MINLGALWHVNRDSRTHSIKRLILVATVVTDETSRREDRFSVSQGTHSFTVISTQIGDDDAYVRTVMPNESSESERRREIRKFLKKKKKND